MGGGKVLRQKIVNEQTDVGPSLDRLEKNRIFRWVIVRIGTIYTSCEILYLK